MRDVLLAGFLGIDAGRQKPRFLWELDPAELEICPSPSLATASAAPRVLGVGAAKH
jgi:hypothetical protein